MIQDDEAFEPTHTTKRDVGNRVAILQGVENTGVPEHTLSRGSFVRLLGPASAYTRQPLVGYPEEMVAVEDERRRRYVIGKSRIEKIAPEPEPWPEATHVPTTAVHNSLARHKGYIVASAPDRQIDAGTPVRLDMETQSGPMLYFLVTDRDGSVFLASSHLFRPIAEPIDEGPHEPDPTERCYAARIALWENELKGSITDGVGRAAICELIGLLKEREAMCRSASTT